MFEPNRYKYVYKYGQKTVFIGFACNLTIDEVDDELN